MLSLETPRLRRAAATLGLLAAVVAPGSGSAQPPSNNVADAQLVEQILEAQVVGGAYAKELIDPLTALSSLYAENGNHSLATAVSEQALQVIRANYGLRTLEQAPLIRQRIRSEEARGNLEEAWRLEHALLDLARRNVDDVRAAPIFHEIGDKRLELLARYVGGERPPQLAFGCYYRPWMAVQAPDQEPGSCTSGLKHIAEMALLLEAQTYYADAINTLRRNELWASDELHELEGKLLSSTYVYGGSYDVGKDSLRRRMRYDIATSAPSERRVETLLLLADWELLFGNLQAAQDLYEQVHKFLARQGDRQNLIDEAFSPAMPVLLPTFMANPLAPERSQSSARHIDVAFEISQYGSARHVKILDTTRDATRAERHRLIRLIGEGRFRPRIVDGQFGRAAPVVVRYILSGVPEDNE